MVDFPKLELARAEIDEVNEKIVDLLASCVDLFAERRRLVGHIATIKQTYGLEPLQPERFAEMKEALHAHGASVGVGAELIDNVLDALHEDSLALQQELTPSADNLR